MCQIKKILVYCGFCVKGRYILSKYLVYGSSHFEIICERLGSFLISNFFLSLNVVAPLFLIMACGFVFKKRGLITDDFLVRGNALCVKLFLPALLFESLSTNDVGAIFRPKLVIYAVGCVLFLFLALFAIIPHMEKDDDRKGVLIQGIFRSNFALFAMAIVMNLYGGEATAITAMLVSFVAPIYNILGIVAIQYYGNKKDGAKGIIKSILTNSMIIAALLGVLVSLLKIPMPIAITRTIADLSKASTGFALVLIGGNFTFANIEKYKRELRIGILGRLVIVPAIFIPLALLLGFRNDELVTLMVLFATPTSVSNVAVSQQGNGDYKLSGMLVVMTSALSCFTLFVIIFLLKTFNFI